MSTPAGIDSALAAAADSRDVLDANRKSAVDAATAAATVALPPAPDGKPDGGS